MKGSDPQKNTKDLLLDATDKLLAERGYKKMTIEDLAKEVGIGKGSVYLHFSSKEEIALSHIDRIIERLKRRLERIAASSKPCEERITEMLVDRVLFRFDSVQHYTQSLNDLLAQLRARLLERRRRYFHEEAEIFARVLSEGACQGVFRESDPKRSAAMLLIATNSLLPYSLSPRELGERNEIKKRTRDLADLLLNGLMERK